MKLSAVLLGLLLPLLIHAAPAAQEAESTDALSEEASTTDVQSGGAGLTGAGADGGSSNFAMSHFPRPSTCTITGNPTRYRKCPSTNSKKCPVMGHYQKGQRVTFTCARKGEVFRGNPWWGKATNGYWTTAYFTGDCTNGGYVPLC